MEWEALKKVGIFDLLSPLGKRIVLPQGIFYWSGRAKKEAKINATIGTAMGYENEFLDPADFTGDGSAFVTFHLPALRRCFSGLGSEEIFPYAPIAGIPELRDAWRDWINFKAGKTLPLTRPIIGPGITGTLHLALRLFVGEGGSVVSPDRFWGNYNNIVQRNIGARFTTFPFYDGTGFNLTGLRSTLEHELQDNPSAVLLLNFPNNPTGYSPTGRELAEIPRIIHEVLEKYDKWIVVLTDDAYEGFSYEPDVPGRSVFYDLAGTHPKLLAVKLDGISKELLFYGARIAAMTFALHPSIMEPSVEAELENKVSGIIRSTVSNSPRPLQHMVLKVLKDRDRLLRDRARVIEVLRNRYALTSKELRRLDGTRARVLPFNSGFFCFADLVGIKPAEIAEKLLREYKTGIIPIDTPGNGGIRIAFCSTPEGQIPILVENIRKALA